MTVANMDPAPLRVTLQSHIMDLFMGHTLAISGKLWGGSPLSFAKDRHLELRQGHQKDVRSKWLMIKTQRMDSDFFINLN
jgi:hypothetical protein